MIANSDFNLVAYAERVAGMTDVELSEEGKQWRRLVYQAHKTFRAVNRVIVGPSSYCL